MKKTIEEYTEELPLDIKEKFLVNIHNRHKEKVSDVLLLKVDSLNQAICSAFDWQGTTEGHPYWSDISRAKYPKKKIIDTYSIY